MTQLLNISAEDAEEYSQSLAQVTEGCWRQIAWAFRQGMPDALGMTRDEWKRIYFGHIRVSLEELPQAAHDLKDDGFTQRESAEALGVSPASVNRALNPAPKDSVSNETADEVTTENSEAWEVAGLDAVSDETPAPTPESPAVEPEPAEHAKDPELEEDEESDPIEPLAPGWHRLGPHSLYCGDSTDDEFINACAGATLAFADPPYNAGKADWDHDFIWQHDYLAEYAEIAAVTPGIASLAGFLAKTDMPYQWSMAAEINNGMTRGALGFGNWICVALFSTSSLYRKAKDHVRIPASTSEDQGGGHVSRKPIRLLTHLIELFTTKGDTVVDPFLGSGTTLMAADRLGRRCIGAEIDPTHCAEIVTRYREAR